MHTLAEMQNWPRLDLDWRRCTILSSESESDLAEVHALLLRPLLPPQQPPRLLTTNPVTLRFSPQPHVAGQTATTARQPAPSPPSNHNRHRQPRHTGAMAHPRTAAREWLGRFDTAELFEPPSPAGNLSVLLDAQLPPSQDCHSDLYSHLASPPSTFSDTRTLAFIPPCFFSWSPSCFWQISARPWPLPSIRIHSRSISAIFSPPVQLPIASFQLPCSSHSTPNAPVPIPSPAQDASSRLQRVEAKLDRLGDSDSPGNSNGRR